MRFPIVTMWERVNDSAAAAAENASAPVLRPLVWLVRNENGSGAGLGSYPRQSRVPIWACCRARDRNGTLIRTWAGHDENGGGIDERMREFWIWSEESPDH